MTRIAHYLGWLIYWYRMGQNGWDYEQANASRLFAARAMQENQQAAQAQMQASGISGNLGGGIRRN